MKIENLKIADLKPYKKNAKKHPKEQVEGLAESIRRFGFSQAIVIDKNNEIIIGHGRLEAAKSLGIDEVPCLRKESLSAKDVRAMRLIDNRIAETGWDVEMLRAEFQDFDFDFTPFNVDFGEFFKNDSSDFLEKEDYQQFLIVIECSNEDEQQKLYNEFEERNLKCKLIM